MKTFFLSVFTYQLPSMLYMNERHESVKHCLNWPVLCEELLEFTLWWENEDWRTREVNHMASLLNTACTSPLAMCSLSKCPNPINLRSASPIVLHGCLYSLDIYFLDIARMNWTNKRKIELSLSLLGNSIRRVGLDSPTSLFCSLTGNPAWRNRAEGKAMSIWTWNMPRPISKTSSFFIWS